MAARGQEREGDVGLVSMGIIFGFRRGESSGHVGNGNTTV